MGDHVQQALARVREMQQRVVENQRFRGWSGRSRMCNGVCALLVPAAMWWTSPPSAPLVHLRVWVGLCGLSVLVSGCALAYWFRRDPLVSGDWRKLRPLLFMLPPLLVGGILTAAAVLHGAHDWLFGIWMLHFGLANLAARHVLPRTLAVVGAFYMFSGTVCLLFPPAFTNPWPMGLVFFVGELSAG